MSNPQVTRGATVTLRVTFKDKDGVVITGLTPVMQLNYPITGGNATSQTNMTPDGNDYTIDWDSAVAVAGIVYWSAKSSASSPRVVVDGCFDIIANLANISV